MGKTGQKIGKVGFVSSGMTSAEGVIKFDVTHHERVLVLEPWQSTWADFMGWRRILFDVGVIGVDPQRYDGAGFGNMSFRMPPFSADRGYRSFLITGTQTGGKESLTPNDCALVKRYDIRHNAITSYGETKPSSEALTHGAIYDLSSAIRFVFHGHVPALWHQAQALRLPTTRPEIDYGTQAMAMEMRRLYRDTHLADAGVWRRATRMALAGRTAQEAGGVLINALARAYARS